MIKVLYYGHDNPQKAPWMILEMLKYLYKYKDVFEFILLHPTGFTEKTKDLAKKYDKDFNIKFVEKKVDVRDYLEEADVVVLPYLSLDATEGNPLCILESWAMGVPIITSRIPELQEIMEEGENCLMADPGDAEDLARQLLILFDMWEDYLTKCKVCGKTIANKELCFECKRGYYDV